MYKLDYKKERISNIMRGQERYLISMESFPQSKIQVFNEDLERGYINPWDEANKRAN